MKPDEKRYCQKRVADALATKLEKLKEQHTEKGKEPTAKEKLEHLRNGWGELKRGIRLDWTLDQAYDWSSLEPTDVLNSDTYKAAAEKVKAEAARVADEIMVGDTAKAVEMMRKFCDS